MTSSGAVRGRGVRWLAIGLAALVWAPGALAPPISHAAEEVKIALVAPLSGRWARQGQLKKMGAEMAIEEINAQGGIKALGGAKIVLREADAGDSVEKAVSAAQRALSRDRISAGIGSWLSSFTLGVTEVAERLQVPWFTLSYADSITERGFKYTFQSSPVSSRPGRAGPRARHGPRQANNQPIRKAAIVGDNMAATVFFFKPLARSCSRPRASRWWGRHRTPPLPMPPPSPRSSAPPSRTSSSTAPPNFPDSIQVLQKVKEFGLKMPIEGVGAWLVTPEYVNTVGKELLDKHL